MSVIRPGDWVAYYTKDMHGDTPVVATVSGVTNHRVGLITTDGVSIVPPIHVAFKPPVVRLDSRKVIDPGTAAADDHLDFKIGELVGTILETESANHDDSQIRELRPRVGKIVAFSGLNADLRDGKGQLFRVPMWPLVRIPGFWRDTLAPIGISRYDGGGTESSTSNDVQEWDKSESFEFGEYVVTVSHRTRIKVARKGES